MMEREAVEARYRALLDAFARALQEADVTFSIRRRLLRFGFHAWSDESDVATVLRVGADLAPG